MNTPLRVFAAAFLLLLIYSCTDHISMDEGLVVAEITAYVDNGNLTKTGIDDDGSGKLNVVWKSGNAISLFFNTGDSGGSKFTTTSTGPRASFTGTINAVSGDLTETGGSAYFWATYPYNESASCDGNSITTTLRHLQPAYANDVSDDLLVTIGRSPNPAIYFRNTYTMIEFTLTQENITKITFSGNNNEYVAGEFNASLDANNKVVSTPTANAVKTVEISPAESLSFATGTKYYFVFMPGSFSKGYTLKFTRSDGYEATYIRESAFTFAVGTYYTMYDKDSGLLFSAPVLPTPTAVDLGLSVKWASFNVGASSPEEVGNYYAWGESSTKAVYSIKNYRWCSGTETSITKYNSDSSKGLVDNLNVLKLEDDAAHNMLGGNWRTPTYSEFTELVTNCTWEWTTLNSIEGYRITSADTGNSIFLPTTGWINGIDYEWNDSHCMHWTSNPVGIQAWCNGATNNQYHGNAWMFNNRYYGIPIRPVYE